MSKIKISVEFDGVNKRLEQLGSEGQNKLLKMILRDSEPYVPKDTGQLRESGGIEGNSLVWSADYASEVYNSPKNYKTPGTVHMWVEKAKGIHIQDWIKELERG